MPELQLPSVVFNALLKIEAARPRWYPLLRRADPHPWGLAAPSLDPVMLSGYSGCLRGLIHINLTSVTLAYGDPLEASAPLVEITTRLPGQTGYVRSPEEALARLEHRDAAVARRDWLAFDDDQAPDPPGPVDVGDAHVVLGHEPCPVTVLSWRHYQAASFADATTAGVIASRHRPLDQVTMAPVPAIEPYLTGQTAFLRRLARQV